MMGVILWACGGGGGGSELEPQGTGGGDLGGTTGPIQLSRDTVDFGEVIVGTTSSEEVILVENVGRGEIRLDTEIEPRASDSDSFDVDLEPYTLFAGDSASIRLTFRPEELGPAEATVSVEGGVERLRRLASITLRGTAVLPNVTVTRNALDFGNVVTGTQEVRTVAVMNNGVATVNLDFGPRAINMAVCATRQPGSFCIRSVDLDFVEDRRFQVEPGESVALELVYRPGTPGIEEVSSFSLYACPRASCEIVVSLRGTPVESGFACSPASLDFGGVEVGACRSLEVTCTNVANQPVRVLGAAMDGKPADDFSLPVAVEPASLPPRSEDAPGGMLAVSVDYCPQDAGMDVGTLVIETDAAEPTEIRLEGSGI